MEGDAGSVPVPVPGDDPGALPRVRGRYLLAENRVQQGGLAGFDHARNGHTQRLREPPVNTLEGRHAGRIIRVGFQRLLDQACGTGNC
ncbi:hypothetical protein AWN58_18765 [Vibrio cholerae]|nr:hypothetical protein AWN58_18765 [Vibrio cholerae]